MAQGLSTPVPSLSPYTHLSLQGGHATTTLHTPKMIQIVLLESGVQVNDSLINCCFKNIATFQPEPTPNN